MGYNYIDESRREHATALPDVEVFESRARVCSLCNERTFADPVTGCFPPESWACEDCRSDQYEPEAGWYYANLDGGLDGWSSEPSGPYPTEAEALAAAREAAGYCAHGVGEGEECEECPAPELWVLARYVTGKPEYVSRAFNLPPEVIQKARKAGADLYWGADSSRAIAWNSEGAATAFRQDHPKTLGGGWVARRLSDSEARAWGRSDNN